MLAQIMKLESATQHAYDVTEGRSLLRKADLGQGRLEGTAALSKT
jgi:hypothetical protein